MQIHQILTSKDFPYEFYLSMISALKVHKEADLHLWVIALPDDEPYFRHVKDKITVRQIGFDFLKDCKSPADWCSLPAFRGHDTHFAMVHLKDVVAWRILHEEGGFFMDLDTLSIHDCFSYVELCKSLFLFKHSLPNPDDFNCAIMIGEAGAHVTKKLYERAKQVVKSKLPIVWGDTGITLLNRVMKEYIAGKRKPAVLFEKENCIVDGNGFGRIERWLSEDGFVWDRCRILHVYRSCDYTKETLATTPLNEEFIYRSKSPYAKLVKSILSVSEWNPNNILQPHHSIRRGKRFHLLGLPHIPTNKKEALSCAYSQKVIKLAIMLKSLGHQLIFYGVENSTVECDEFVQISTQAVLDQTYGKRTDLNQFYDLGGGLAHEVFGDCAIREINRRKRPNDFLLVNCWHKPIVAAVKMPLTVEFGIGYRDPFTEYRIFESYAWMHYLYGTFYDDKYKQQGQGDGRNYDSVIPNYFAPSDFSYLDTKGDYFLYLGRLIGRKGIEIAIQVVEHIGGKLLVAGQKCNENINLDRPHVEYVGYADVEKRRELLSGAKALFVPTKYIGPFEGVHVEAGLSGTAVITSDWGVFGESVLHGTTGYRCRTFEQYIWAANNIHRIKPYDCYTYALNNYSMNVVKWMYEEYFEMLLDLNSGRGWYELHHDRNDMDAWSKFYPEKG